MNSDDKDEHAPPSEDAFYQADYDEDTIDYDLDSDTLLEGEDFEPELGGNWAAIEPNDQAEIEEEGELTEGLKPQFELQQEQTLDPQPDHDTGDNVDEPWEEDDYSNEYSESLPVGLIIAAVIALLLLAAGGYGVIAQRTAMQDEIRQLQATLATTTSNTEVASSRQAQRSLEVRNQDLQVQLKHLQGENQRLRQSLAAPAPTPKIEVVDPPVAAPAPPKPAPKKSSPKKAAVAEPVTASSGWFVNFGSYTQEATANSWASKLTTEKGKIAVVTGKKGNTLYFRVRIINLPSREIAEKIARELEQTHNLPRLWIGNHP
jgi:cell division septation protein DedD